MNHPSPSPPNSSAHHIVNQRRGPHNWVPPLFPPVFAQHILDLKSLQKPKGLPSVPCALLPSNWQEGLSQHPLMGWMLLHVSENSQGQGASEGYSHSAHPETGHALCILTCQQMNSHCHRLPQPWTESLGPFTIMDTSQKPRARITPPPTLLLSGSLVTAVQSTEWPIATAEATQT